ncbi:MAG: SDR family oxidoreductase [Ignavibacteriales bacterium]|nr:SDR family oxidoreductase [Ignavibacteriales bacterium]
MVVGSTGALGAVIVQRFIREGAQTIGASRSQATSVDGAAFIEADATDAGSVEELFRAAVNRMGHLDIVVNTVGSYVPANPISATPPGDWDRAMDINLKSTFLCTRAAIRCMRGRRFGRVFNTAAQSGVFPESGKAAYSISKSGVILLTELAAQELRGTGITINVIAPGIIDTASNRAEMPNADFSKWAKPESIADAICNLCSEEAGNITGSTLQF